ncbi:alcohol dehydrogenase GroES-like domain-containing protein [Stachybotrys elegans]|uniref:Alcohol dehydrogenase GroES-like domain-containing protein n=1 Tax=Stachybotrys elegans TaxID=80388 RepID=A0A8K0WWC7_9HYPO|nr:alcohol dehydrogenase GroES-like domain-containing protein [Stachybotrys elegans]
MAPAATGEGAPILSPSTTAKPTLINASVLHGPKDLRLETRTLELPAAGELQIAIKATGICGSDVSYYKKFANGDLCACQPLSLGHESSGEVVAIGPQVQGFKIGDRVALEVGVSCGTCGICLQGRYNLCKKMRFRSSAKSFPHYQGTLQDRINHPAVWCHKLPNHVSYEAAALLEPLSVAIHAVNRARPVPGSTALVIGAGTVGLLTAAMARQSGCTAVTIADIDAGRVAYALANNFATHGYVVQQRGQSSGATTPGSDGAATPSSVFSLSSQFDNAKSMAAAMLAAANSPQQFVMDEDEDGVDITFECTGKELCMQAGLYATKPGGKVVMVGMGTPIQTLPLSAAHLREVDILGIFRYANTYPTGIRLLCASNKNGLPNLDNMVTHRFKGLHQAHDAFELAGRTFDNDGKLVLKVVIEA